MILTLRKTFAAALSTIFLLLFMAAGSAAQQASRGSISGTVRDAGGALIDRARVALINSQQALLGMTETDAEGRFRFDGVADGTYVILTSRPDFSRKRVAAKVNSGSTTEVNVVLEINQLTEEVTVTAETGVAEDKDRIAQQVNVISEDAIRLRTTDVLAQAADEEVGVALQRTSPTMGEFFVRGLTGKNVAVYVDGVRYTTSTQRGGVSTFFNLNEPTSLRAVEVLRGPNSAQYGSDSLGGTVQLISRVPGYGGDKPETHGEINTLFSSGNLSFGANTLLTYGTKHFGLLANAAARRINRLRPAGGVDSHSALTRFLGLSSDILGTRLPDTAFTQYGGTLHFNYSPQNDRQFVFHYQRNQQDGGKRYDQLLGGDGNLIADLHNLMLDFFYARYLKQGAGFFDNFSGTLSFNSQREERVNQGGQGNPFGAITHQYERTNVYGFNFYLDKRSSRRNTFLIGADAYHERVNAPAFTVTPTTNVSTPSRPRVPDGARYLTFGLYAQDIYEVVPEVFRLSMALRYNVASYHSRAARSPLVGGQALWPDDSLRVDDFSGRIGAVFTARPGFNISFNYSRGFRAPNITDLGTLGLTGDGFEVDYTSAINLGGTIGTTAGGNAISTGIAVSKQRSEISNNYDLGLHYRRGRFDTDLVGFLIDINDAIVKQALVLPITANGSFIGGQPVTIQPIPSQPGNGLVLVPLSTSPVLVRANFTDARLYGLEYTLDTRFGDAWTFGGNFTYIRAYDKATGLPPNIEGGTPPATGFLRLRYQPRGKHYWVEGYSTLAGRQRRLSSLDLSDRRTGAPRTRNQIRDFFRRGACMRGLVASGPDGVCGTNDETILIPTGETLTQVQNRVLGSANAAPLFTAFPGYGLLNVRGGYRFAENSEVSVDFENIGDKRYRNVSWGIDGPGRSVTLRYQYRF
jgi:hemoglobin/transferrin/lactoferrin receptor protein